MEILVFLLAPFVASLILTGIHAYLGVHVVERGVIFVDLALAQIAALGATIAILIGMDPHGQGAYWLSLAFTFIGAAIFAFARTRRGHIPQEAFIGIAYAVASAAAILAMSKATGETEHLKDMLVGNILAVDRHEVIKTAILYGAIGIFHYIFRHKFLLISTNPAEAEARGMSIRFWGLLLPHRALSGRHAFCRSCGTPPGDWLDHGHSGVCSGGLFLGLDGPADGGCNCLHIWRCAGCDVLHSFALLPWP